MRLGSTVCGSSAGSTKSASLPSVIEPLLRSSSEACAVQGADPQRLGDGNFLVCLMK